MINYMKLLGDYYTGIEAYMSGDPSIYTNIIWKSSPISQAELDAVYLVDYKTNKIIAFSDNASSDITNGFISSALGFPCKYDSEPEDQLNLVGSVASNSTMYYACYPSTPATQIINFNGNIVGTNNTGIANNSTQHLAQINVNGTATYISLAGTDIQTFNNVITQLNADADFGALGTASIVSGNIVVSSKLYGSAATIQVQDISFFNAMTGYTNVSQSTNGSDATTVSKQYLIHTAPQLLQVLNDGKDVKLTVLQKFAVKKAQILAATTTASVDLITW